MSVMKFFRDRMARVTKSSSTMTEREAKEEMLKNTIEERSEDYLL